MIVPAEIEHFPCTRVGSRTELARRNVGQKQLNVPIEGLNLEPSGRAPNYGICKPPSGRKRDATLRGQWDSSTLNAFWTSISLSGCCSSQLWSWWHLLSPIRISVLELFGNMMGCLESQRNLTSCYDESCPHHRRGDREMLIMIVFCTLPSSLLLTVLVNSDCDVLIWLDLVFWSFWSN